MPNQNKQESWKEKFDKKFKEEPKCEHGHTFSHYTCEPHDYPHVIGNRFGPDCERCTPPRKQTLEDIKSFIEQTLHQEREKAVREYIKNVLLDFHKSRMDGNGYDFFFKLNTDLDSLHPTNKTKE